MSNISNFCFIITRHVNSETTNKYWNHCIRCIRKFYPNTKIVVIDDNSNSDFLKAEYDYKNVEIIQSEFKGRGELLGYYYFYKNNFAENAIIMHDSIFIHKKINFQLLKNVDVIPLWHFNQDKENIQNSMFLISELKNKYEIQKKLLLSDKYQLLGKIQDWYGCFGVQSYINRNFLIKMVNKYNLFSLLNKVKNRPDRCCLERIFGVIFNLESAFAKNNKSLFGNIHMYNNNFDYTFDKYMRDLMVNKKLPKSVIKVWTGR